MDGADAMVTQWPTSVSKRRIDGRGRFLRVLAFQSPVGVDLVLRGIDPDLVGEILGSVRVWRYSGVGGSGHSRSFPSERRTSTQAMPPDTSAATCQPAVHRPRPRPQSAISVWPTCESPRDGRAVRPPADTAPAPHVVASVRTGLVPGPSGGERRRRQQALERAEAHFVARVVADGGIRPWRSQTEQRLRIARATFAARGRLSRGLAAGLLVALADPVTRDRCWRAVEADPGPGWPAFWLHLSDRALPPYRTEPLFLLSWCAWRQGAFQAARTAASAALAEDPSHRGAQMLLAILSLVLEPDRLPALVDVPAVGAR